MISNLCNRLRPNRFMKRSAYGSPVPTKREPNRKAKRKDESLKLSSWEAKRVNTLCMRMFRSENFSLENRETLRTSGQAGHANVASLLKDFGHNQVTAYDS